MKKLTPSFVAVAVFLSLNSQNSSAKLLDNNLSNNQCLIDVPTYNSPIIEDDISTLPVEILSDTFEVNLPNQAIYQGNVSATQGNRMIHSQQIILNQSDNNNKDLLIKGDVLYQDNLIEMKSDEVKINLDTNDVQIEKSQYHLVNRLGRGEANQMEFINNRYIIMNNGSFTACPVDNNSWNIEGSKLIHDNQEQLLKVWNAVFRVGKVPVLYLPYLQLPTGDKRRSGLLIPELTYDSIDGVDFSLPVYWNIAPNYDATLTTRAIQRRGVQFQTEMRYLNYLGLGTIAFDWLNYDDLYSEDRKNSDNVGYSDNSYRWLFHWENDELINYNWRFSVDATRVSDNQYITDLGSEYASETDGYLEQYYQIGYSDEYWDINLNYRYFQALRDSLRDDLYRTEPQLNVNYYHDAGNINFSSFGQISRFVSTGSQNPKTWRFHLEPTIDYTQMSSWASISTKAGLIATHYHQDVPDKGAYINLDRDINRFIPKLSVDGKVIFERETTHFDGYTQTLEPRIKYVYMPYRDQSTIYNYDSSLLQSDYIGLFREQPYSGLDRIASSNKIAAGITSRFYDKNKVEQFNLSLGQIYYFNKSRTGDNYSPLDQNDDTGSITWATDTYWRINPQMIFRSGIQYDTKIDKVLLGNAIFEYRQTDNKLIQLSYRYANKKYIDSIGISNQSTPYQQSISQFGFMSSWPLTDNTSVVGALFYDIHNGQTSDSFIGLNYADCCWGVTLQYGRKITDWDSLSKESEYENKFSINFELRGLSKNSNSTAKMLDFGLLPYKTAFEEK